MTNATGQRARAIAAIHAYADLLAIQPDLPLPQSIQANHHTTTAAVQMFAVVHGLERRMRNTTVWADLVVNEGDIKITHTLLGTRPAEPDPCAAGCSNPAAHAEGGHDV